MGAVLITGGSGYVGGLVAASLLADGQDTLVLPIRPHRDPEAVRRMIGAELRLGYGVDDATVLERLVFVELPPLGELQELDPLVVEHGVDQVVHTAGCLDYFDEEQLQAVNVGLTTEVVRLAERHAFKRMVYISTAFAGGYRPTHLPESVLDDPDDDPTVYTRTKRDAERVVAACAVPWLVLRPSIVIGDSRDGHYSGKQYGVYQLWSGNARLLCRTWLPELHVVGPTQPTAVVHQDALQAIFLAALKHAEPNTFINMVSDQTGTPTMRELWAMWMQDVSRPAKVVYYPEMEDIPVDAIHARNRALLALASVNLEIASHAWTFDTNNLDRLRGFGLEFAEATEASVRRCQDLFVQESPKAQKFLNKFGDKRAVEMVEEVWAG